jgi:hypothetical protein
VFISAIILVAPSDFLNITRKKIENTIITTRQRATISKSDIPAK